MEVRAEIPQGRRNGRRVLDEPSDDSEIGKAFLGAQQQAEVWTAVALTHSDQVAVQCIERDDRRRICEEIRVDAGREGHLGRIDSCLAQQARGRAHGNEHHEAVSREAIAPCWRRVGGVGWWFGRPRAGGTKW